MRAISEIRSDLENARNELDKAQKLYNQTALREGSKYFLMWKTCVEKFFDLEEELNTARGE